MQDTDPADAAAALAAAWRGFAVTAVLTAFLATWDAELAICRYHAMVMVADAARVLRRAPSLPPGLSACELRAEQEPAADEQAAARAAITDLAAQVTALLSCVPRRPPIRLTGPRPARVRAWQPRSVACTRNASPLVTASVDHAVPAAIAVGVPLS